MRRVLLHFANLSRQNESRSTHSGINHYTWTSLDLLRRKAGLKAKFKASISQHCQPYSFGRGIKSIKVSSAKHFSFWGYAVVLYRRCIYRVFFKFLFVELTPSCWWRRGLIWWAWMPATKCLSMHWSQDGRGEKNRLLTSGVWHFSFC